MTVTLVHPEDIPRVPVHHQVAVATGSRTVHMAGQVAWDAEGTLVGAGDLAAQTEQCYRNVVRALAAAGASVNDLVKVTAYVVDLDPDKVAHIMAGRTRAADALGIEFQQPGTFVGVTSLFAPDYLIEVDAIALLD